MEENPRIYGKQNLIHIHNIPHTQDTRNSGKSVFLDSLSKLFLFTGKLGCDTGSDFYFEHLIGSSAACLDDAEFTRNTVQHAKHLLGGQ